MANEFIARRGLISLDDARITGSLYITEIVSASQLYGNGANVLGVVSSSYAVTASYAQNALSVDWDSLTGKPTGLVSSSAQAAGWTVLSSSYAVTSSFAQNALTANSATTATTATTANTLTTARLINGTSFNGSANIIVTASYATLSNIPVGILSSSTQFNALSNTSASYAATTIWDGVNNKPVGLVSSSAQATGWTVLSSSYAVTSSFAQNALTANSATTATTATSANTLTTPRLINGTSFNGSANIIVTASYATLSNVPVGIVSSSAQASGWSVASAATLTTPRLINGTSFNGSANIIVTASYATLSNVPVGIVSSSGQVSYTGLSNVPAGIVSSSTQTIAHINGATITPAIISSSAIHVTGRITAGEFHSQVISSSIIYESGSTKFGNTFDDVMSVTGSLQVSGTTIFNGPVTFAGGGLGPTTIGGASYSTASGLFNIGTSVVGTVSTASYDMAHFDYVIRSGSNLRTGTVMSIWNGASVEYTDTSTNDIGNTTNVELSIDILGADARLKATVVSSNSWTIKAIVRAI